jgi:hypothetical protein
MESKFKRFSRSNSKIIIERYEGAYKDGVFQRELKETIAVWASIQPYRTIEAEQIFNVEGGQRVSSFSIMYSPILVYQDQELEDEGETTIADVIIEQTSLGVVKYKPVRVEEWGHLSLKHYRAILRVFDGH